MSLLSSFLDLFRSHHHHQAPRGYRSVLFVLRKPHQSSVLYTPYHQPSSGLVNSARFVVDMLSGHGVDARLTEVVDANAIDRAVTSSNPDVVILEAIWCPPTKLRELTALKRHAHRQWIVRNHSEIPFLSMEGQGLDWLLSYAPIPRVTVSCNSPVATSEIGALLGCEESVLLLPNYYPVTGHEERGLGKHEQVLDIGCFGAIRPLKNHLEQAVAAILYARELDRDLRFHINASRVEGRGDSILKSLRALFAHAPHAKLVEHGWLDHHAFVRLCKTMDLGLQVSFSETFNIVAADLVNAGVPVVGSSEIPWIPDAYAASTTSAADIVSRMRCAARHGAAPERRALAEYSREAEAVWLKALRRD